MQELERRLDELRARLRARYGWTHLDVRLDFEGPGRVRVLGSVAVPRLRGLVAEQVRACVGPDLELALELGPMPVLGWYALAREQVELWAEHPSCAGRSLATELRADDGPVGLLAEAPPGLLVRARDGTVGWIVGGLGAPTPARPLLAPRLPEDPGLAVLAAARAYLGVPYLLGGASAARIDCSGLVARAFAALGVVLPRNSKDQLALAGGGEPVERALGRTGDLLFMRSRRMQRMHVGIASGDGAVVHASRTRGGVVEEPARELEADAQWLRRVGWDAVLGWSRTQAGHAHVELLAQLDAALLDAHVERALAHAAMDIREVGEDFRPEVVFRVLDVFSLEERVTVIVGDTTTAPPRIGPTKVTVLLNGAPVGSIALLGERMPGPAALTGRRSLETRAAFDWDRERVRTGQYTLRW